MNNWRKVLSWLAEGEITEKERERLQNKYWEEQQIPFDRAMAEALQRDLVLVSDGDIHYAYLPNVFHFRDDILHNLKAYKKYEEQIALKRDFLISFYEQLLREHPIHE